MLRGGRYRVKERGSGTGFGAIVGGTLLGMKEPTHDELFLDAENAIVLDALARIGGDPQARSAFFRRLLAVAQEVAEEHGRRT